MKNKMVLTSIFAAAFLFATAGQLFAEQVAKGVVTKVSGGTITVRDKHGRLTTIHIRPGDIISIKLK